MDKANKAFPSGSRNQGFQVCPSHCQYSWGWHNISVCPVSNQYFFNLFLFWFSRNHVRQCHLSSPRSYVVLPKIRTRPSDRAHITSCMPMAHRVRYCSGTNHYQGSRAFFHHFDSPANSPATSPFTSRKTMGEKVKSR